VHRDSVRYIGTMYLATSSRTHYSTAISAVHGASAPGAGTQNVMLWVSRF